jgi:hypothetical protein
MNPQEQGETTQSGNEASRKKVDALIGSTLDQMIENQERINPAMVNALTKRYGKPTITNEEEDELKAQLRLVGEDSAKTA